MKRFLSLLIALSLVFVIFAFSACGGGDNGGDGGDNGGEQGTGETTGSGNTQIPGDGLTPDDEPVEEEEFDPPTDNNESTNLDNVIKW
ncbi:MAG: hypothetical protein IJ309_06035 [Clostridia bacterium]|nr:hypothetical protein [Clostridia bacterium]